MISRHLCPRCWLRTEGTDTSLTLQPRTKPLNDIFFKKKTVTFPWATMDGGLLLENKPKNPPSGSLLKSQKVLESSLSALSISRVPESVTKWPCWLLPNTSSHSTRMGAKLVLIEGVIHRCSPPSEGRKQTRAVSHIFCRRFDEGTVFFWVTRRN